MFDGITRSYTIAFGVRSGSNAICDLLAKNGLGMPGEWFQNRLSGHDNETWLNSFGRIINQYQAQGVFGSKMSHDHRAALEERLLLGLPRLSRLDEVLPNHRWVHLIRRDKVLQAISLCRAEHSGQWAETKPDDLRTSHPIYDFLQILSRIMLLQAGELSWSLYFQRLNIDPLVVVYEDFFADLDTQLPRLIDYLGGLPPGRTELANDTQFKIQRDQTNEDFREIFASHLTRIGETALVQEVGAPYDRWSRFFGECQWRESRDKEHRQSSTGEVVLCRTRTGPMMVYAEDMVIGRSLRESGQFGEHVIDEVLAFLREHCAFEADTFIDVGANIGTHSVHALMPGRFRQAISIEAESRNFVLLQANIAIRGLSGRTRLIECALSDHIGEVEFELCPTNFGDHRVRTSVGAQLPDLGELQRATQRVRADTADRVLGGAAPPWVQTLVWIDTQGHEGQIIAGAATTLAARAPAVVLEFWPYGLERAGGRECYFEFLRGSVEIYDLNRPNWRTQGRVNVAEIERVYETMLADTRAGHYPHTNLLCLRPAALRPAAPPPAQWAPMNALQRSLMTIGCRDTDFIPKSPGAGGASQCGDERTQRMHNGIEVVYGGYHGDWMAQIIRGLSGHHEPQEEAIFHVLMRYIRQRTKVVELGCFWAYYTQWFLQEIPDSTALCVESDLGNLDIGRRNTELNGNTSRVRFVNAWIGGEALAAHTAPVESGPLPATLPMLDAAAVLAEAGGGAVELLHLDIQGAELPFLRSITEAMAREKLRFVMVSTHHSCISGSTTTHPDCVEALRALGATILVEHDVIESFSGDGMILASLLPDDRDLWFPPISRNRAETSLFKRA